MKAPLYDISGKTTGTVDLQDSHFGVVPNTGLIHRLLILQQANGRIAIAHTKHRGEVRGSTRKMFKQKGTGNARMGDRRSPMRRGGGVVFGPRSEQNWTVSMNKQERRLALLSILSTKANTENIKVVEAFDTQTTKTKYTKDLMTTLSGKTAIIAITREESHLVAGAQNLIGTKVINVEYLNPHDLLKFKDLVLTQASLAHLYSHFAV
jgi:large subunit ribosomal protein L4